MTEKHPFIRFLREEQACSLGRQFALSHASPQATWRNCTRPDWMCWLLCTTDKHPRCRLSGVPLGSVCDAGATPDLICVNFPRRRWQPFPWGVS